jgi:MoxR-like ATPase
VTEYLGPGQPDTGLPDAGLPDAGLPDAGLADTGQADAGLPDTGQAHTGQAQTGKYETGHSGAEQLTVAEASARCAAVLDRVGEAVVGKREQLRLVLAAVLAGGHVLLEDLPGLGKTLAARSFAQTLGLDFRRLQFTPDLLPADVTGSFIYDQRRSEFDFRPGPLFTNLLLADEVNRTPPRTQAALLEAMQERQVTVEGVTRRLDPPFIVLATANPIEYEGTYQLPEAQLDRFLLRVSFGYLEPEQEWEVISRRIDRRQEEISLGPVTGAAGLLALQAAVERIDVEASVGRYMVGLAAATRSRPEVLVGASPRGALALMLCSRALALISGRDYVTPDDVKAVAVAALGHRLTLRPETFLRRTSGDDVVRATLGDVPVPATVALPGYATGRAGGAGPVTGTGSAWSRS